MSDLPLRRLSNLVKFQFRIAKKRYLKSKRIYEYGCVSLHIPRKFHELIKPFLKRDLEMKITAQNGSLIITLTPAKTTKSTTATTDVPRVRPG
jgi:hypothetical protein